MIDYKKMYCLLFNAITDALDLIKPESERAIEILVKAQQKTEEIYIAATTE